MNPRLRFIQPLLRGLRLLALSSLPGTLMLGTPVAQAYEPGWRTCAQEGQICRVSGRTVVRYGVPGNWSTRTVRDDVLCGNAAFGDPAPNSPKRCEVAANGFGGSGGSGGGTGGGSANDWVFCAPEGEVCRFRGASEVRFGADGRYSMRRAFNAVRCDVSDFGDPAYGVTKQCEVRRSAFIGGGSGGSWVGGSSDWRYCAAEGQTCRVNGRAEVRFGDGQRYATRVVNGGGIACDVANFGDPAYGVVKHCEIHRSGWGGSGGGGGSGGNFDGWDTCAREGGRCSFSGRAQVRYGAEGRWAYRDAWGSVGCDNRSFGADPFPNRPKVCQVKR
jgi:hypothetical protein